MSVKRLVWVAALLVACNTTDPEVDVGGADVADVLMVDLALDQGADAPVCDPADLVNQVDPARIATDLTWLTEQPGRTTQKEQAAVAAHLKAELEKVAGLTVSEQSYTHLGEPYVNLVTDIPGTTKKDHFVMAGAHYDTFASSPGADDNASGTAAVVEAARVLAACPGKKSIRLVLFSNKHSVGSTAFVAQLKTEVPPARMAGFLNVDMVGFGPADEDLDLATRLEHEAFATDVKAAIDTSGVVPTTTFVGNHCG